MENLICSIKKIKLKIKNYLFNLRYSLLPNINIRKLRVKRQIALAETLQLLIGKDHTTPEGMKLAKQIEQLFKDKCAAFKEEYKLNFGVYYSPKLFVGA